MTNYKTPDSDIKHFESFLDEMEDKEFDNWYDNDATDKQQELADELRESNHDDDNPLVELVHNDALRAFYSEW